MTSERNRQEGEKIYYHAVPTYQSAKKEIPHTKYPTSLTQCLAIIEVIYMEQIVSYWEFHAISYWHVHLYFT
jgi:hypothetical protein